MWEHLALLGTFGVGAFLMRGAGCTINDILDRDFDARVERTKSRPIASGALTRKQAVAFLGLQLTAALGCLVTLNPLSIGVGAASLVLVGTYPLMKRITYWPQAFLGLTFNYGALLGWTAATGGFDPTVVLPLYASGICWTLVYDTIYAHQDKKDDIMVGVKSTALLFGDKTKRWLSGFAAGSASGLALAGYGAGMGLPYFASVAAAGAHLAWQVGTVNIHDPADCGRKFAASKWLGAVVFAGIELSNFLAVM